MRLSDREKKAIVNADAEFLSKQRIEILMKIKDEIGEQKIDFVITSEEERESPFINSIWDTKISLQKI